MTTTGKLESTVGELPLKIEFTGLECLECTISNEGGSAVGSGKLKLTGATVAAPSGCAVSGGAITTLALKIDADYMVEGFSYWLLRPNSGTTLSTVTLTKKTGFSCAISGSYLLSGTVFVEALHLTGVYVVNQSVTSSSIINSSAGGKLEFSGKPAALAATATFNAHNSKGESELFGLHQ